MLPEDRLPIERAHVLSPLVISAHCSDRADLDEGTGDTQTDNPRTRHQWRFVGCQVSSDRPVRRRDIDAIDEQHGPLHDVVSRCTDCAQCSFGICQFLLRLRRDISWTNERAVSVDCVLPTDIDRGCSRWHDRHMTKRGAEDQS